MSEYGEDANRLRHALDKAEARSDLEYQIIVEFLNSFARQVADALNARLAARTVPDDSPSTFSHDWNVGYNDGCRDAAENIKRKLEGLVAKWANRNCLCSEELESELARVRQ